MNRRSSFLVVGLLAAALIGVALMAVPGSPIHQKPTLGLDLQGGLEVTLQAVPPVDRELTEEDQPVGRHHAEPSRQARRPGARDPHAGRRPDRHPAPRVSDPEAAAEIIGTTAQLELYDLESRSPARPSRSAASRSSTRRCTSCSLGSKPGRGGRSDAYYVVNPNAEAHRPRAVRVRGGGAEEDEGEAAAGSGAVRGAAGHGRRHLRQQRPGCERG